MAKQYVCDRCGCINTELKDMVNIDIPQENPREYEGEHVSTYTMEICRAKCLKQLHVFIRRIP